MAILTTTAAPTTSAPAPADARSALLDRVTQLLEQARTERTLDRLATDADPRTSRERRQAWRSAA